MPYGRQIIKRMENQKTITESEVCDFNNYVYKLDWSNNPVTLFLPQFNKWPINIIALDITNPCNIRGIDDEPIIIKWQTFTTFTFSTQWDGVTLSFDGSNRQML